MKKINLFLLTIIFGTILNPFIIELKASENYTADSFSVVSLDSEEEVVEINNSDISFDLVDIDKGDAEAKNTRTDINTTKDNIENGSTATNEAKVEERAGTKQISVSGLNVEEVSTLYITQKGDLLTEETKAINSDNIVNEIKVKDGKIIGADSAIVQTIGGYDYTSYAYDTVEAAAKQEDGVSLSGGAFDGRYLGTEEYEGKYYAHILISGYEGYISLDEVQIIPSSMIQAQSFYQVENEDWVFYQAVDPLTTEAYTKYAVGAMPEWAQEGIRYYSYDDENYYEENIITEDIEGDAKSSYTYFQNLPFTSTAEYTGTDYKNWLSYKGFTNSEYYNYTNAFVEAQDKEKINSLYLFSMANHEGYYGTSNYSQKCNNFFGLGAYDSNPDNACVEYGYPTPRDGILAESIFLTQGYADTADFRFAGTHPGNKSSGVNRKYASDPDWGKAVASHMYEADKYLGSKEYNKYKIYAIDKDLPVYSSSGLSTPLKLKSQSSGIISYYMYYTYGSDIEPRVVVTNETNDAFEFQIPTPINISSSSTCKFTEAKKGAYPNYSSSYSESGVTTNTTASFACDYSDWSRQFGWFDKNDGGQTYKVIANNTTTRPGGMITGEYSTCDKVVTEDKYENGNTKYLKKVSDDGMKKCETYYYADGTKSQYLETIYYEDGTVYDYTNNCYDKNGKKTYYRHKIYDEHKKITYERIQKFTAGQKYEDYQGTYYSGGKKKQEIESYLRNGVEVEYFNNCYDYNGNVTYYRHIMRDDNGRNTYDRKQSYKNKVMTSDYQGLYYSGNKKKQTIESHYSSGVETDYINNCYDESGNKTYYRHIIRDTNNKTTYDRKQSFKDKVKTHDYQGIYYSGDKKKQTLDSYYQGKVETSYTNNCYDTSGKKTYYRHIERDKNGNKLVDQKVSY